MITGTLINPKSIAVIGASKDTRKPGGKVLFNLLTGQFSGPIYPVNPREEEVQGLPAYATVADLPPVDLAILAIPAAACVEAVRILIREKETSAFIVLSAGFSEEGEAGAALEQELAALVEEAGASLIGPNCIGVLTPSYNGVFTTPIPHLDREGCDLISGSGATAVFIMEAAAAKGLHFSRLFSVGNSAQIGVEEVLEYLDGEPGVPNPKLLYIENIARPVKLLRHARSLVTKGCRIAAIKAGTSDAGSRAASSHTGAMAGSDVAVDALFRKAGIVRCYGREELATIGAIFSLPPLPGGRIAVVTHAGGPAVMLTDTLSEGGLEVPPISGPAAERLKEQLHPGSSVANPIDFLATGTAEQLGAILDACERDFDNIDAVVVIFGSPGLFPVDDAYAVLRDRMQRGGKPIYPILPSVVNAGREIAEFTEAGLVAFPDEVIFGRAFGRVYGTLGPFPEGVAPVATPTGTQAGGEVQKLRRIAGLDAPDGESAEGYLPPERQQALLDAAGIRRVPEEIAVSEDGAVAAAAGLGFPVVMKVVGPLHKSDVGGVALNVASEETVRREFRRIMAIPDATAVLLQPMASGLELFAGVSREGAFGHLIMTGLGGIFVETLKDYAAGLVPLDLTEALTMIRSLRGYPVIAGARGRAGADEEELARTLTALSRLVTAVPEIAELDLNPLIATETGLLVVDARIRITPEVHNEP